MQAFPPQTSGLVVIRGSLGVAIPQVYSTGPVRTACGYFSFPAEGPRRAKIVSYLSGAVIRESESVSPVDADAAFCARAHRVYQVLYPALKSVYG